MRRLFALLLFAVFVAACVSTERAEERSLSPLPEPAGYAVYLPSVFSEQKLDEAQTIEDIVFELINAERQRAGLARLARSRNLDAAAEFHAMDMATRNYFSHDSAEEAWSSRVVRFYGEGWKSLGEIIAAGYKTEDAVVAGGMASDGHKKSILSENFTEAGVGYFAGGSYGHYWVVDFGRKSK